MSIDNESYWSAPNPYLPPSVAMGGAQPDPNTMAANPAPEFVSEPAASQPVSAAFEPAAPAAEPAPVPEAAAFEPAYDPAPAVEIEPEPLPTFEQPAEPAPVFEPEPAPAPTFVPEPEPTASYAVPEAPVQAASPFAPEAPVATAVAAPAQKQKGHGWIVAIVTVVCLFAFLTFSVSACTGAFAGGGWSGRSHGITSGDAVAIIDISGTIQYDGSACSPEGLKELLDEAEDDDSIVAVVLRVDSGGGTATAGEEMAVYVSQFSKPIVVSSASINASAAYEISSQADYIFVAKSTEIGAIGTALQVTDLSGLLEKLGINMDTITSADEKDSSYGYRPLTDEERAYYQDMVDQINSVFVENVAEGRNMSISDVKKLATGMPFTGMDAVKNGLADEIGTREDAIAKAAELAGVSDYTTTTLSLYSYDFASIYDLLSETKATPSDLERALKELQNDHRIQ